MSAVFWTGAELSVLTGCGIAFIVWQSFNGRDGSGKTNT